jgi:hypothetical protein
VNAGAYGYRPRSHTSGRPRRDVDGAKSSCQRDMNALSSLNPFCTRPRCTLCSLPVLEATTYTLSVLMRQLGSLLGMRVHNTIVDSRPVISRTGPIHV